MAAAAAPGRCAVRGARPAARPAPATRRGGPGNEYLFQMLAEENVATLTAAHDEHGIATIVASCPHCFNTISNEYPQFGLAGVEVIHHTQLLDTPGRRWPAHARPSTTRRWSPTTTPATWAATTRSTTRADGWSSRCPGSRVVEMELHHRKGMCCGAGGARMWMEEREGQRINHRRDRAGAGDRRRTAIATACPFCLIMLRDGTTDLDRTDVAGPRRRRAARRRDRRLGRCGTRRG